MNIKNYKDYNLKLNIYNSRKDLDRPKKPSIELKDKELSGRDKVSISDQAKSLLKEQENIENNIVDKESDLFKDMLRAIKESSDPRNNPYDHMIKCIQIATRIINGDTVPVKDETFLMENEPKMYSTAILLRHHKDNPKDHKSLLEDEKDGDLSLSDENNTDSVFIENLSIETESTE